MTPLPVKGVSRPVPLCTLSTPVISREKSVKALACSDWRMYVTSGMAARAGSAVVGSVVVTSASCMRQARPPRFSIVCTTLSASVTRTISLVLSVGSTRCINDALKAGSCCMSKRDSMARMAGSAFLV